MVAHKACGMLELDVGEVARDCVRGLHVAKRGGEDDVSPIERHLRDRTLGIGTLRHAFLVDGFNLIAKSLFHVKAALIVLVGPAAVTDGTDIDKADLERAVAVCAGWQAKRCGSGSSGTCCEECSSLHLGLSPWLVAPGSGAVLAPSVRRGMAGRGPQARHSICLIFRLTI